MNPHNRILIGLLTFPVLLGGCASIAPAELTHARDAYVASSTGLTARLAPTEVYDAKKVLDQANRQFDANGDTQPVRDYAYIAIRKFELADAKARTAADRETIAAANERRGTVRDQQAKSAERALGETRDQLKEERNAHELAEAEARATTTAQRKELDEERQRRVTAEDKLAAAMKDLATVAAVKEESRGVVITLSGSVLFAFGSDVLLETSKSRLDQIAEALKQQGDQKRMVVEGYTDNRGTDAVNLPLSRHRAESVRDYLLSRGVDASRISATGMGSSRPVVDNNTAENRAVNRRVEIVILASPMSAR